MPGDVMESHFCKNRFSDKNPRLDSLINIYHLLQKSLCYVDKCKCWKIIEYEAILSSCLTVLTTCHSACANKRNETLMHDKLVFGKKYRRCLYKCTYLQNFLLLLILLCIFCMKAWHLCILLMASSARQLPPGGAAVASDDSSLSVSLPPPGGQRNN